MSIFHPLILWVSVCGAAAAAAGPLSSYITVPQTAACPHDVRVQKVTCFPVSVPTPLSSWHFFPCWDYYATHIVLFFWPTWWIRLLTVVSAIVTWPQQGEEEDQIVVWWMRTVFFVCVCVWVVHVCSVCAEGVQQINNGKTTCVHACVCVCAIKCVVWDVFIERLHKLRSRLEHITAPFKIIHEFCFLFFYFVSCYV